MEGGGRSTREAGRQTLLQVGITGSPPAGPMVQALACQAHSRSASGGDRGLCTVVEVNRRIGLPIPVARCGHSRGRAGCARA